jgi:uncharacterized protein (TIGR03435 family)
MLPPSHTVHISPANSDDPSGLTGTLKALIVQLLEVNPIRIQLPPALDNDTRYNVAVVPPAREGQEKVNNPILQAIEDYFAVTVAREERMLDVYIVTTANGKSPACLARPDNDSGFSFSSVQFEHPRGASALEDFPDIPNAVGLDQIRGISATGTLEDFCRALEAPLDRPVVNETNLAGAYEFNLKGGGSTDNDFLERLRDQFNLNITPAQRRVRVVVLKPR